ncbi:MAG TPA: alpha-amylase family glycosyl hydrolase, partial [Candidatus Cloacimonadota bacterium]|nr:alpha-amylase family glycosyl hydrolase [Candidatus Cloacimonadota bacterium]
MLINKDQLELISVTFSYQPPTGGENSVYVTGDFNHWSQTANKLDEENGIYSTTLRLNPGVYAYKFIVDGNWIPDPTVMEQADDSFHGKNSILRLEPPQMDHVRLVTFRVNPLTPIKSLNLVGSFNLWNPHSHPFQVQLDGSLQLHVFLKKGTYLYKFLVDNDYWENDPNADEWVEDGYNGVNSVLHVDERFPVFRIKKDPHQILTDTIPIETNYIKINLISENTVEFRARLFAGESDNMSLMINDKAFPMQFLGNDSTYDYYHVLIDISPYAPKFHYCFMFMEGDCPIYVMNGELSTIYKEQKLFVFDAQHISPFLTPEWAKNGVMYQIFVDRFCNGNPSNNQDFHEWYYSNCKTPPPKGKLLPPNHEYFHFERNWYEYASLKQSPYMPKGKPDWWSFYGGDIEGIRQKLSYLEDLGITILYLNPIFEAKSNHKYDATDYMKLDPHFASIQEFHLFVKEAHEKGIRIIIDVAFNHTGETFWAFRDCVEKGEKSQYWNWYDWKKWPLPNPLPDNFNPKDYYQCWWGVKDLPDLNYDLNLTHPYENAVTDIHKAAPNWPVVDYILDVAEFWLRDMDIDGFRLDVPEEVPFWFWKLFRKRVKSVKPDAYIVGEIWFRATEWVNAEYFDAVMNYAFFKDPALQFFMNRHISASEFDRQIQQGLVVYPIQAAQTMMNILGTHDTYRIREITNGKIEPLKLAIIFQMTFVGIPHIYYGDEIAMMGASDPDNRRPFNWKYESDPIAVGLHDFYRKLIHIR